MTPRVPIAAHLIRYVSLIIEATHPEGASAPPQVKRSGHGSRGQGGSDDRRAAPRYGR
jgi:hypothetical protein